MSRRRPQSEVRYGKGQAKLLVQNDKTAVGKSEIITPRRLLMFVIFFLICLAVSMVLVGWMLK